LSYVKDHAKVPKLSKGDKNIFINDLNPTNRSKNWLQMRSTGVEKI